MGNLIEQALSDWGSYLQSKFSNPRDFHRYLSSLKVHVDPKTAARWYNGETLPSPARIIEMAVSGFKDPSYVIFERASLVGDNKALATKTVELEEHIAALQKQLKDLQSQH